MIVVFCDFFTTTAGETFRIDVAAGRSVSADGHELGPGTPDSNDTDAISYLIAAAELEKLVVDGATPATAGSALDAVGILEGTDAT